MQNLHPKNKYTLTLSKSQLELLSKLLDHELSAAELGYSDQNSKTIKRTMDAIWEHLKPTPEEKQQTMHAWVNKIYANRDRSVLFAEPSSC